MGFKQIFHGAENDNDVIATEIKKQEDYEAEVVVYRALEKLKEPLIVFHSFDYSHDQFRIWDSNHDRKTCSRSGVKPNCKNAHADEAEHDFVVFGPDYIVMIEVKNPSLAQAKTHNKTSKSKEKNPDVGPNKLRSEANNLTQATTSKLNDNIEENTEVAPNDSRNKIKDSSLSPSSKTLFRVPGYHLFGNSIKMSKAKKRSLAQTKTDNKTSESKEENPDVAPNKLRSEANNLPQATTSQPNDNIEENSEVALNDSRNKVKDSSLSPTSEKKSEKKPPILVAIEKATTQLEKGMKLLEKISDSTQTENGICSQIRVFRFVAFPNICKNQTNIVEQNIPLNIHAIYKDDFKKFHKIWANIKNEGASVLGNKTLSGDITKIQSAILRLFTSHKGQKNEKCLSLKECVVEIDQKLRNSEITFRGNNTPPNPSVIKTSELKDPPFVVKNINIFETCLKLKYITNEQRNAFEDENYPIVITGAAGSGKTIVLLAKAIHTVLTQPGTKIFILFQGDFKLARYSEYVERAGIKVYEYGFDEEDLNKLVDKLAEHDIIICHGYPLNYFDFILKANGKFFPELNLLLFADDSQDDDFFWHPYDLECWSCLVADFTQESQVYRSDLQQWLARVKEERNFKIHWLGRSYRNTHNIVSQLIQLGEEKAKHKRSNGIERDGLVLQLSPIPKHGHFIHGPEIIVKIYRLPEELKQNDYHCFVDKLIDKEYNKYSEFCVDSQISCAFLLKNSLVYNLEQSLNF